MITANKSQAMTKIGKGILALIALIMVPLSPTLAYDETLVDTSDIGRDSQGVVNSGQILELGVPSANGLRMEGENYHRQSNHGPAKIGRTGSG